MVNPKTLRKGDQFRYGGRLVAVETVSVNGVWLRDASGVSEWTYYNLPEHWMAAEPVPTYLVVPADGRDAWQGSLPGLVDNVDVLDTWDITATCEELTRPGEWKQIGLGTIVRLS